MKRRSKIIHKDDRARRPKASKPKRVPTLDKPSRPSSSAAAEQGELARITRERDEALEQQAATSELLTIISSGAAELETTFRAILEKAARLCDAEIGNVYRWDGDALYLVAAHNAPPALEELRRLSPFRPKPDTPIGQMIATKKVAHVADLRKQRGYLEIYTRTSLRR
jgi:two-component system, NtrC family, sensor kinase